jgi:predicted nuclease with TOPRIM domain
MVDAVEGMKKQLAGLVSKRQSVVAGNPGQLCLSVELQAEQREFEEGVKYNQDLDSQRNLLARKLNETHDQVNLLKERLSREVTGMHWLDFFYISAVLEQREHETQNSLLKEQLAAILSQEKMGLYVDTVAGAFITKTNIDRGTDSLLIQIH